MEAVLAHEGAEIVHHKARGIGHTAMHWCGSRGEVQIMVWLLSLGADVNARNTSEATPLHAAAGNGQVALPHLGEPFLTHDLPRTPLHARVHHAPRVTTHPSPLARTP